MLAIRLSVVLRYFWASPVCATTEVHFRSVMGGGLRSDVGMQCFE